MANAADADPETSGCAVSEGAGEADAKGCMMLETCLSFLKI